MFTIKWVTIVGTNKRFLGMAKVLYEKKPLLSIPGNIDMQKNHYCRYKQMLTWKSASIVDTIKDWHANETVLLVQTIDLQEKEPVLSIRAKVNMKMSLYCRYDQKRFTWNIANIVDMSKRLLRIELLLSIRANVYIQKRNCISQSE